MKKLVFALVPIIAVIVVACAPSRVPAPTKATPVATGAPATPATASPQVSPEDAEWQKVIAAAQKEGKVTLYTWGYIGDTGIQIKRTFEARYGVGLDLVTGRGAEFTERLKTERRVGQIVADVAQGAGVHLLNMRNSDLLAVAPALPALANKGDFRLDPVLDKEGYLLQENLQLLGPMVNTKMVRPEEEPKSWQDMLNSKWKGKMMAHSPLVSTGMYIAFIPLINAKALTVDFLRDVGKQDLVLTRGDQETAEKLSRGEYPVALILADTMAGDYVKQGAPIKALPMTEGVVTTNLVVGQVKGAPHPNAARLFMNWILTQEGQTTYHKAKSTGSVRKDVQDFRPAAVTIPVNARQVLETPTDITEETQKYVDRWLIDLWGKK
ncbi:MAG: extracellular solute-binding protein [Chloroflexi bacterium]|nr:extracellular solute-binding protein [Chloroflexota bacterium]